MDRRCRENMLKDAIVRAPICLALIVVFAVGGGFEAGSSWASETADSTAGPISTSPESGSVLSEIVVTANKRKENLQDVPISITVATAEQLKSAGVESTVDLPMLVPGLFMNDGISGLEPHLRGIGTTNDAAGAENSVATYIDGVYMGSLGGGLMRLNNIQQVEVDKGPQGTLFGRNATGGVINITTKDPSQVFGGSTSVTYGNYNTVGTTDYVTGGITDTLAADLAFDYSDQGQGYGRNLYNGDPVQKTAEYAARTKWLLTPTPDDRITLALDFEQNHSTVQTAYHAAYGDPTNWGPGLPLPTGQPFLFTGGPWDTDDIYPGSFSLKQGGASLNYQHTFDIATLTDITAYRQAQTLYNWSVNPAPSLATLANETENERQFTEEMQLVSPTSNTVKWVGGLFFMHASAAYDPFTISGPDGTPFPLQSVDFDVTEPTYSGAVYGQATTPLWSLRDTNLTLGLRYTVERRALYGNEVVNFEPTTQIPPSVIPSDAHKIFQKLTWRFALDHHFTDDLVGYISDNRGFKSGVYNTLPPTATPVSPEVLDAYEIGIKGDFVDHRLRVNAAAFYYNYTNIQVTITQAASTQLVNGAKAQIYGLDLDVEGKVTENFSVTAGLEVLHDEFKSFPSSLFVTPLSAAQGGGGAGTVGSAAGNNLPYTPNVTFDISVNYTVPISYGKLDLSATYAFTDHWFPTADNISEAPESHLLNAGLGWTLRDNRTQLKLWARNLTNQAVPMILLEHANPGGNTEEIDAPPRTYGVTVQYSF